LKIFVSVDAEGMPWAPSKYMMSPGQPLYSELRRIMTLVTNVVAEEAFKHGVKEVIVADSHGAMVNIDPFELDKRVSLIRGFPRPMAMISRATGVDAAFFLGYHSSPQLGGVLGHTYSGRIVQRVRLSECDAATEYLLNTYALGELGVPVALVAGDAKLREHVEKHTPWARFIALKDTVSYYADHTPPWNRLEHELREAVKEAIKATKNREVKPLKPKEPWIEVELKRPFHADIAELFPCVERIDGVTIRLTCNNYIENYKLFEGIVIAAYSFEK
jgi:D-amino peptidase